MSSPLAVQSLRVQLFANGFPFVPIPTGKKERPHSGWQAVARGMTAEQAALWPENGYFNTAILCDGIAFLDIDTDDSALAQWIVSLAYEKLGPAPIRSRSNSCKVAMPYRYADSGSASANVVDHAKKLVAEVRGDGKYVVVDGGHPSGVPYVWNFDLKNLKRDMLNEVSEEQLGNFLDDVAQHVVGNASRSKQQESETPTQSQDAPIPTPDEQRIAASVLTKLCDELRAMRRGEGRNQALNNAALQMGELCAGWGVDREPIAAALLQACSDNGYIAQDGLSAARETLASGFSQGLKQPRARHDALPNIDISKIKVPNLVQPAIFTEKPRPLRRAIADANPFPIDALGPFSWPAYAIADKIQCPPAIAALSVLGVASLAAQGHADVLLPRTGQVKPLSLFLVSIGESGERKSAADNEAKRAIAEYERELATAYELQAPQYRNARDAWESERQNIFRSKSMDAVQKSNALDTLIEPQAPLTPMLTCPEPTFEGLCLLFRTGQGALGLFSDEGGHFVGGHALSEDARLRTAAGLSSLWDGSPIKRVRAGKDESYVLLGRRLAMHLMLQPKVASELLSDPLLKDQGLLSRILVSYPQSTAGTRFGREPNVHAQAQLDGFARQLANIVKFKPMTAPGKRNELTPRQLQFDTASHLLWCEFADKVEAELAPFGRYESIKGLANKLPEHAARIAGVMTIFENFYATQISSETLLRGISLAEHFANEALRLFDAGVVRPEIALAESLLEWLTNRWNEPFVSIRVIQQFGPNSIRDAKTAKQAIAVLEEHGWLAKAQHGALVQGVAARDVWQIFRD